MPIFLILSFGFFFFAIAIALLKPNVFFFLFSLEILLLAVSINFIFTSILSNDFLGIYITLINFSIAALDTAVGLIVLLSYYNLRLFQSHNINIKV